MRQIDGPSNRPGDDEGAGTGNWYRCTTPGGSSQEIWVEGGAEGEIFYPVNPEDVARRALAELNLRPITVGIAPKTSDVPDDQGIVGMPVWLWADGAATNTVGPASNSATDGPVTVHLTARVSSFIWDLGDGTTTRCNNPGTAWYPGAEGDSPSGCGHNYMASGKYPVSATTQWVVEWAGGGMEGTINLTLTSDPVTMHVTEVQTVVES